MDEQNSEDKYLVRDIEISNVVFFGIVMTLLRDIVNTLPAEGALIGTPAYMASEQVVGKEATVESDIYSLGIVIYEMLTNRLPFESESPMGLAAMRLTAPPTPINTFIPGTSKKWERAIMKCLAKEPADRFASALDFIRVVGE